MASIIIFGTLWGFAFKEWKDARPSVRALVWAGVALLVGATIIIGYGNAMGRQV
jgi:L-rhamnose-H+ transport protein